jgi:hypothetical protein
MLAVVAGLGLSACGGSEISEAELDRERADAAQDARQEAEIKSLKRDLSQRQSTTGEAGSSSAPTQPVDVGEIPADARPCGSAFGAGSASCPFVENVSDDYYASGQAASFTSHSPTTGLSYTVTCNGNAPTVCTAGKAAVIYIP